MAGALEGLKILDFTTLLPGPFATMILADMGAEVLRIVSGSRQDPVEGLPPFIPGTNLSAVTAQLGRNKQVMTLNLKDDRAVKVIHQLLAGYDIVIEQFRPGVMASLNLDYESLKSVNPRVIYCSLTGYGQTGPMSNRAGHDINYMARSGVASYSGKNESGPLLNGIQIADLVGSNNAVTGILAAVIYRANTGKGQFIDISMTDGMTAFNVFEGAACLVDGREPVREKEIANGGTLYDFYETKDGKFASLGAVEPYFFSAFCQTIGRPDLTAGGIASPDSAKIKSEIREIIKTKTLAEWMTLFNDKEACFEPVLSLPEVFSDQHVLERNMVVEVPGPGGGKVKQIANPIKFSESNIEYRHTGIPTAEANSKIIMKSLGYTEVQIEEFAQTGLFS